jgi:hypothetical protein
MDGGPGSDTMRAMTSRFAASYPLLAVLALPVTLGGCSGDKDDQSFTFAWDWVGVVGTGQSLAVGAMGTPIMAIEPSYGNLKLSFGGATVAPPFDPALPSLAMAPLTEPLRPVANSYPSAYPANLYGETPHSAMASQITALVMKAAARDYVTVHSAVGESGQPTTVIKKSPTNLPAEGTSGRAYDATLFEAAAITRLAAAAAKTYGIGAIVMTHGESDAGNAGYANDLYQLLSDYNQDLAALTGQTAKIPMLVSQQNSVPTEAGSVAVSAVQVWRAGVDHPGEIICTGPKYQYSYATDSAHVHFNSREYERLGEKYGQVFFERSVLGHDWQPLQPTSIEVSGNVVTVRFHVPVPPLVWDEALPPPHGAMMPEWALGRGFEVTAASARQNIDSVEIVGGDTVRITCRNDLSGRLVVVGYASTAEGGTPPQAQCARWGHLRDSDPFIGAVTGSAQPNYCVAFQQTIM